jgi:antitoxin component YwqK of YwqJK toxin-antitoxin module
MMNPKPIKVVPLEDFELLITFKNGEEKIYNAKHLLNLPVFKPLNNKAFFDKAKANGRCVYWSKNLEICPDTVYEKSRRLDR